MYHKTVFENGVRIISERLDHFRSVSLGIWVEVGSRDEVRHENGISHFIEHMIFKGTRQRSSLEIAKALDAIGGLSNAFTGKEQTCFHSKVLDKHFNKLADILSDIFLNSAFDPFEMDRERQVILQEINMVEDTPDEHVHMLLHEVLWENHPLGMSVLGDGETVSSIQQEHILHYIRRQYLPERIIIAAAGNIDHERLVSFFRPLFDSLPSGGESMGRDVPTVHGGVLCKKKDLEQVHICIGGKAPNLSSEQRLGAAVLNTILGGNMSSRLFQEIREKRGMAYSIYSFLSPYMDTGLMGIYLGTDHAYVNQALKIIKDEIDRILDGDISESDLAATKEHLIGGILLAAENADTRMMRLAKNEFVFGRYVDYDELIEKLERVSIDEVVGVSSDSFGNGDVSMVTLGPFEEDRLDRDNLVFGA